MRAKVHHLPNRGENLVAVVEYKGNKVEIRAPKNKAFRFKRLVKAVEYLMGKEIYFGPAVTIEGTSGADNTLDVYNGEMRKGGG